MKKLSKKYESFEVALYNFADKFNLDRGKDMIKFCKKFIKMHEE